MMRQCRLVKHEAYQALERLSTPQNRRGTQRELFRRSIERPGLLSSICPAFYGIMAARWPRQVRARFDNGKIMRRADA
jgi:hypothetical protein